MPRKYNLRQYRPDIAQPADPTIRHIPLSRTDPRCFTVVDLEDFLRFGHIAWSKCRHRTGSTYVKRKAYKNGPMQTLSRMILQCRTGEIADHIDGNPLNNRRSNLRIATPLQNANNQKIYRTNSSGHRGVTWNKRQKKWIAQINIGKTRKTVARCDTAQEASAVYECIAANIRGEFNRIERQDQKAA